MTKDGLIKIAEGINEEFEGAKDYIWTAMEYKESNPDIAKMYCEMANQEAEHAQKLFMVGKRLSDMSGDEELISMWELSKGMVTSSMIKFKLLQEQYKS